jgi:hypothetical protein
MGLSSKDEFCGMARSSSSKKIQKDASDSDSEDEVGDELELCLKMLGLEWLLMVNFRQSRVLVIHWFR